MWAIPPKLGSKYKQILMRRPEKSIARVRRSLQICKSKRRDTETILSVWSSKQLEAGALRRPHQKTIL